MLKVVETARITSGPLGTRPFEGNYGAFLLPSPMPGWMLLCVCDDGTLPETQCWEHVSVSARRNNKISVSRTPSWQEMAYVKDMHWEANDVVVQFHPAKRDYVNCHPDVLHLWRHRESVFLTPPPELVGPRQSVTL